MADPFERFKQQVVYPRWFAEALSAGGVKQMGYHRTVAVVPCHACGQETWLEWGEDRFVPYNLDVHHVYRRLSHPDKKYSLEDVRPACHRCHRWEPQRLPKEEVTHAR